MKSYIRRLAACALTLVLLLPIFPKAEMYSDGYDFDYDPDEIIQEGGAGGISWTVTQGRTLTISGSGAMEQLGDNKWYQDWVSYVVIEDGITTIMDNAFSGATSILSVSIPDTVTYIGKHAFDTCLYLESIKLPRSLKSIEEYSFYWCGFREVTVPDGVTSIAENAFGMCEQLEIITIPPSVTSIGHDAFYRDKSLKTVVLSEGLTEIEDWAFWFCTSLQQITIPGTVQRIGANAFSNCESMTEAVIEDGVQSIGDTAFGLCVKLTSLTIPDSVNEVGRNFLAKCDSLTDVNYGGTPEKWEELFVPQLDGKEITVHYTNMPSETVPDPDPETTPSSAPTPEQGEDYVYNTEDPGKDVKLPVEMLDQIETEDDAAKAVQTLTSGMTAEQKQSATGIDLATLYAERAAAMVATIPCTSGEAIQINAAQLNQVQSSMDGASGKVATALTDGGIATAREMPRTVIFDAGDASSIVVRIDPDVLKSSADVDKIRVETDQFAITFQLDGLTADLDQVLEFKAELVSAGSKGMLTPKAAGSNGVTVKLTLPDGGITNPVTLSLRTSDGSSAYETMTLNGAAAPSKYNPVTITMDGKTTSSGTYSTETNEVDFTDIGDKSAEMQAAIKNLASKGVLKGTTETTFSPDKTITRAEIATLLVRVLGLYDETITTTYTDVTQKDWYYPGAASSQKAKLMSGYGDNMFHGLDVMSKAMIAAASGNVLIQYMDYKVPANPDSYLKKYSDEVPSWGKDTIALVTQENIMLYRTDGKFLGDSNMTRGDAAIIIDRLFSRIW